MYLIDSFLFLQKNKLQTLFCFLGAFVSFVSLKPYIFWYPSHWLWSIIFTFLYLIIASWHFFSFKNNLYEKFLAKKYSLIFGFLFLVYISALKTHQGAHKLWFLIYPIIFFYLISERDKLEKTFNYFKVIFIISLIPGILYQVFMLCGIEFSFNILESTESLKKSNGVGYLELPGVVFQSTCAYPLGENWSNFIDIYKPLPARIISRFCGLYVEPGVVGTISILILATQKSFKNISSLFLIAVGAVTLSLAFIISFFILLLLRREWKFLLLGIGGIATLILLLFKFGNDSFVNNNIISRIPTLMTKSSLQNSEEEASIQSQADYNDRNKRESKEFERVMTTYWSSFSSILFGVASDASEYSDCSTYKLIMSNYGLVGLILLCLFFAAIPYEYNKLGGYHIISIVFIIIFFINFLQRPYVWTPFNILIYLYGILPQKAYTTPNFGKD